jgi:membrane protein YdbS with pleckstrin-like domain
MRWRSESVRLRLPGQSFWSRLSPRKAVRLVSLEPIPSELMDPAVRGLVLHEIDERVFAEVRHHWIRRLVGLLWLALGVPAAFVLFLFGTPDDILLVTLVAAVVAVVAVRRRDRAVVVATAVASGAVFVLVAGPYHEHIHLVPLLLLAACIVRGSWSLVAYRCDLFVVTDKRVLRLWGVLFKNRGVVPIERIVDTTVQNPLLGRLLGYGHLVFESAAQEQGLRDVRFMPDPDMLDRIIQILQYGAPPDDGKEDAPAAVPDVAAGPDMPDTPDAEDAEDAEAEPVEQYTWGGDGT